MSTKELNKKREELLDTQQQEEVMYTKCGYSEVSQEQTLESKIAILQTKLDKCLETLKEIEKAIKCGDETPTELHMYALAQDCLQEIGEE